MSQQSQLGSWPTQGEAVDGALWRIAGTHHQFPSERGIVCLCGHYCGTNRKFTEHIISETLSATNQSDGAS